MANRGKGYGPPLNNISEAVGNTPLVKISDRICPPGRTIYAKCEFFNPCASVKDRLALAIIEAAEKDGTLKPGQTVVEATSGNTGIGRLIKREREIIIVMILIAYRTKPDSMFSLFFSRCHDVRPTRLSLCNHYGRALLFRKT